MSMEKFNEIAVCICEQQSSICEVCGTGFILTDEIIITAAHVIENIDFTNLRIRHGTDYTIQITPIKTVPHKTKDIALIKYQSTPSMNMGSSIIDLLANKNQVPPFNGNVSTFGYSTGQFSKKECMFFLENDFFFCIQKINGQPLVGEGDSGGPVYDSNNGSTFAIVRGGDKAPLTSPPPPNFTQNEIINVVRGVRITRSIINDMIKSLNEK